MRGAIRFDCSHGSKDLPPRLSVPGITRDALDSARELNEQMRLSLSELDAERFGRLNSRFHAVLCSRCDARRVNELVEHEWARMDIIRRSAYWYAAGRAAASIAEHDDLLGLIESGADADVIEAATRAHEIATLDAVVAQESTASSVG